MPASRPGLRTVAALAIVTFFGVPASAQLQLVRDLAPGLARPLRYAAPELIVGSAFGRAIAITSGGDVLSTDGTPAGTFVVRDIPTLSYYSSGFFAPRIMTRSADVLLVCAGPTSAELWRTDGTATGTYLVKRLAEPLLESPTYLFAPTAVLGNLGLFFLETPGAGQELWRTDGTAVGTFLLHDIAPGPASSRPDRLTILGNRVFFAADDGTNGRELWSTDGTQAGTALVRDLLPGSAGSEPAPLGIWNGTLYFGANDGTNGRELWRTDGTSQGTTLVRDIEPGAAGSDPGGIGDAGTFFVFSATTSAEGAEPWRSDGTAAGTSMIANLRPGPTSSWPGDYTSHQGRVYFRVADDAWCTDGTAAGTVSLLPPGLDLFGQEVFASLGAFVYFVGVTPNWDAFLYRTSGTPGTTTLVTPLPGATERIRAANGALFGAHLGALWRSDGTPSGTVSLTTEGVSSVTSLVVQLPLGRVLFSTYDYLTGLATSNVLWASDGTFAGTQVVRNRLHLWGIASVPLDDGAAIATAVYDVGDGLAYRTDGTFAGTYSLFPLPGAPPPPAPSGFVRLPATTLCIYNGGLWRTDGTAAGAVLVRSGLSVLARPVSSRDPPYPVRLGHLAVFFADDGTHGREPWISDGTAAGTQLLRDLRPGAAHAIAGPSVFVVANGRAYFAADDGVAGNELWATDGTTAGTVLVADIEPGPGSSSPEPGAVLGARVLFAAHRSGFGRELWSSDGTASGTMLLRDLNAGPADSHPRWFLAGTNLCYFNALEDPFGHELWRTDGTAAGTFRLTDSDPGAASGNGEPLHVLADRDVVLFSSRSPSHGTELWCSDGTVAGTAMVQDLQPGPVGALHWGPWWYDSLALVADRVVLPAWTEATGLELFAGTLQSLTNGLAYSITVGLGCAGTNGVPALRAAQPPLLGSATFGLELATGRPSSVAMLGGALAQADAPLGAGCWLHLQPPLVTVFGLTDPNGTARWPLPLPGNPVFLGTSLLLQAAVADPLGAVGGIAVSPALRLVLGVR